MPATEVLLLSGTSGGKRKMAQKGQCRKYATVWNPVTGREQKQCISRYGSSRSAGLSGIGRFGQTASLKGTVDSVKGVLITGGIAAGGAIITQKIYAKFGGSLGLTGWKASLAKMATGIALGILVAKVLKKPKLAAAFAIGPVVAGMIELSAEVLGDDVPALSGFGATAFEPVSPYSSMYAGTEGLGSAISYDAVPQDAYPGVTASPRRRFRVA